MSECIFFREEEIVIKSQEIGLNSQENVKLRRVPWCAHKHSPAPREIATNVILSKLLTCGGSLDDCQVPLEKRGDLDNDIKSEPLQPI
jgi:hypothetical protein